MDDIDEEVAPQDLTEKEEGKGQFRPNCPKRVGEEGVLTRLGLRKKLLRHGEGWDTPEVGDEVTVHYSVAADDEKIVSGEDEGEPLVVRLGQDNILKGCEEGLVTMRKGEMSIFTLPPEINAAASAILHEVANPKPVQLKVELISWIKVIDVCEDGGILKRILWRMDNAEKIKDEDEVTVKYEIKLEDGSVVAKTPEDGIEFKVGDGHLCPAIKKIVVTMRKGEKAIAQVQPQYAFGDQGQPAQVGFAAVPPNSVIFISLELIAYKLLEYVTEDKKIVKKIMNPIDRFEKPNTGTVAKVRYIAKLADGTVFDKKGYDGEEPFEFKVDEDEVIAGLDLAAATMRLGEIAQIIIDPEYGFHDKEIMTAMAVVPPFSKLYYEVEMVSFTKVKESWDMKPEERIEHATKRKQDGNAYFKSGNFQRAALRYDLAEKYVEFDSTFSEEQKAVGRFLRGSCILNNAACQLKLKEFRKAISLCSKVLKLDSNNVKALFRRAQAYTETMDFDLAELDLNKALCIEPDNKEAGALLARVKSLQSYYDKKDSRIFSNMLEKLSV